MIKKEVWHRVGRFLPLAVLPVAVVLLAAALPAYQEKQELQLAQEQQRQQLDMLLQFKNEHRDYAAYRAQLQQELHRIRLQLPQQLAKNELIGALQRLAEQNAVQVHEVKLQDKASLPQSGKAVPKQKGELTRQQVQLYLEGDYYNMLAWMRQVERHGWQLSNVKIKGDEQCGKVQLEAVAIAYAAK